MVNAFSIAGSGLQAALFAQRTSANNVSNALTPGFRARRVDFATVAPRAGVAVAGTPASPSPGGLGSTGLGLDVAIRGEGFFALETPEGIQYTRAGNFGVDGAGNLVSSGGYRLSPPTRVPFGTTALEVGGDGTVTGVAADGTRSALGTLEVTRFPNAGGLVGVGGNRLAATAASGEGVAAAPGSGGAGVLSGGFLEGSNVDLAAELTRQALNKHVFSANLATLKVQDEILESTLALGA